MSAVLAQVLALQSPQVAAQVRRVVQDDPLAIVGLAAQVSQTGNPLDSAVLRACREEVALLEAADPWQLRAAIEEVLLGKFVDVGLQWLYDAGVVALALPELAACVNLQQEAGRRHKDVWEHTKAVTKLAVRKPAIRWAALLHDIGKVPTRRFTRNGVHFHGHAEVGARMFDKMCQRLAFDPAQRELIRFLIKHHLRTNAYGDDWTDSAVRRFGREMSPYMTELLYLSRADITSKRPGRRRDLLFRIADLQKRVRALQDEDAKLPPLPAGLGNAIMQEFALPPGKHIGDLRKRLEAEVAAGNLEERQPDAYYIDWLRTSGEVDAVRAKLAGQG